VTYSTSLGSSTITQYETTGVPVCTQNGAGTIVTSAPSSATSYSLPGVVTPNSNTSLQTSVSYNASWQATNVLSPNGATATTTYDTWGRPSTSTIPDGATTTYSYSYSPVSQQTAVLTTETGTIWKRTTLDGFGRVSRVENGNGATTTTPVSVVDTQYAPCGCSPLGKMFRVSMPYAGGGSPSAWTTYTYDERGRTVRITASDGTVTGYVYIGNETVIDAYSWKVQTMDALGNLVNVTEPDSPNSRNITTTYTYNALNQLQNVTMCSYVPGYPCSGITQMRTFGYTNLDMTSATNPENGTVTYTYDTAHHVLSKTDAIGQITTYDWDIYGRLTAQKFYPLHSGTPTLDPNQTVLYYYDTNPYQPTFSNNAQGRLTAVLMNTYMWYEYSYTPSGRVQDQRFSVGGNFYDSAYTWDQEGRMSSLPWPSVSGSTGPQYQYQFDAMGRMNAMVDSSSGSPVATATYTVANQLLGLTYFGMTETRDYNSLLQLTGQSVTGMFLGSVINLHYNYPYGANYGLIYSSSDSHLGETLSYTYDSLSHLSNVSASTGWSQSYNYDGFGNMTYKQGAGPYPDYNASFDGGNHQVGMGYDANGNQTSSGRMTSRTGW
jgi:YD repeat-containing protein